MRIVRLFLVVLWLSVLSGGAACGGELHWRKPTA